MNDKRFREDILHHLAVTIGSTAVLAAPVLFLAVVNVLPNLVALAIVLFCVNILVQYWLSIIASIQANRLTKHK